MHSLHKILVTGAQGQIGAALLQHPLAQQLHVIGCSHQSLDITQPAVIQQAVHDYQPDIIINTAAYTAVDRAEHEADLAMLINHQGAKNLAVACQTHGIPLLHLSTDYVFSGESLTPYHETDEACPINVYGKSKYLGESAIRAILPAHLILRVSGVFSALGNNFLKTILRLAQEKEALSVVSDQVTCPTHAKHIASVIYALIQNLHTFGTYHYCDHDAVSWHQFASTLIAEARSFFSIKTGDIHTVLAENYLTAAKRPAFSVLACNKIQEDYGIARYQWQDSLIPTFRELFTLES